MSRLRRFDKRNRPGVVLLITLVLLVLLSMLAYTLSVRVSTRLHRDQYLIDYSKARYGCDSAVRYALATLEELKPQLISRPNDPDFSDIFAMSEAQYQEFLTQYGLELQSTTPYANNTPDAVTDFNDVNDANDFSEFAGFDEPDTPAIPGPYGPAWPFVTEPVELEIGSARVRIEIEDENAKYPIAWAMLEDDEIKREATAGFETFCEWTNMSHDEIDSLKQQLKQVSETKPFKLEFKPITKIVRTQSVSSGSKSSATRATRAPRVSRIVRKTISAADQIESQNADFASSCTAL